jgi:hypothetical protein
MSAERRHGRTREVLREVARFWGILWYVAFGLVLAHFDTSAPWWAVVFITSPLARPPWRAHGWRWRWRGRRRTHCGGATR